MKKEEYQAEWCLLQNQFDSYEKHSLYIKLVSILVLAFALTINTSSLFVIFVLFVLWLQDGIWKTFQSRIETRLFELEKGIRDDVFEKAFQFNSHFQSVRLTGFALIGEYVKQSVRPTVAFPHFALIAILLMFNYF